jgi:Tol biopolymer transport system component
MPRPETVAAPTIVVRQVLPGIAPDLPSNPSMVRPTIARLDPSTADLVLTDLGTGDTARLHVKDDGPGRPGLPGQSTLNRDGTRLAFAWEQDNVSGLRILDIAGHRISELSRSAEESILPFQWSADGRSVAALLLGKGGRARAALFAADNGAERTIKTFTDVPLTISLSPDGHWLAYDKPSTDDPAHRDIGIVNTDSGIERTIVDHPADDLFPEWTPGGDALIFASSRTGTLGLWMLPVQNGGAAGEPLLVKDDIGRMWPLGFTSADTMYFTARSGYVDVFTAALGADGTVAAKPAAVSRRIVGANISPAWSADGQRLAYVSELREGGDRQSRALVIRDVATDEEQLLIPDLRFFIGPRWSADGTTVMVKGADGTGRWGLHAVHVSDSTTEPLLLDTSIGQYGWGAAGQIYYVVRDRIMVHRLRDGSRADADTVLLDTDTQGITRLATSPVSGALAYSAITRGNGSARSVLRVHDAAGDRELFSTSLPETIACESWSPDGRLILFSTIREPNAPELFAIGSDGGEARRLGLQMDGLREVSVNAAGRLAFTGGWPSRSLWAIEHLPQPNP